ncbi:galactoside alpha-(1,2)-fucosyltransferase 2-like [Macrobrachium nipponense]|uniref:galactoside alpha-(1,2)-fucosyltransferase 2-like n=1 Tax=Macrobrachium nipponense TaxID=159736 RepID=UPI0030C7D4F0
MILKAWKVFSFSALFLMGLTSLRKWFPYTEKEQMVDCSVFKGDIMFCRRPLVKMCLSFRSLSFRTSAVLMLVLVTCLTLQYMTQINRIPQQKNTGLIDGIENKTEAQGPLPVTAISPRIWYRDPAQMWENLQLPVLTSEPLGRLGNVMGEYATLLALGRVYGATVRMHPKMERQLKATFPNISMEPLPEYPFEIQLFNTFPEDIRREFTFSLEIQRQVRAFWEENSHYLTKVTIGVHVRRTDYMHALLRFKSVVPEQAYFRRAMDYYREKHPGCRFLVSSDDLSFARRSFGAYTDVLFTPGSVRELDMALLASCNHSIITVGSFGFWCGYLCGGEVVYPDISAMPTYTFQRTYYELGQLKNFIPLPP